MTQDKNTLTRILDVDMTLDELRISGREIADLVEKLSTLERQNKEQARKIRETMNDIEADIQILSRMVRHGKKDAEVRCAWEFGSDNTARLIRLDTGEVVEYRPMTEDEKQEKLRLGIAEGLQ